jgi:hypothetical protein
MRGKKNTEEDFWLLVEKTEYCWNWIGRKDKDGYGNWFYEMKNIKAHRFSMKIAGKEIPDGMVSRHLCNNPSCVNTEHIVAGTQKENIRDQINAGTFSKLKYGKEIRDIIINEYKIGGISTRGLSKKYGVSKSQIHNWISNF